MSLLDTSSCSVLVFLYFLVISIFGFDMSDLLFVHSDFLGTGILSKNEDERRINRLE